MVSRRFRTVARVATYVDDRRREVTRMLPGAVLLVSAAALGQATQAAAEGSAGGAPDAESVPAAPSAAVTIPPAGDASRPVATSPRRRAGPAVVPGLALSFRSDRAPRDARTTARDGSAVFDVRRRLKPAEAFALELREESERYMSRNPFALAPDELADDQHLLRARSRAAAHVLSEAAQAALDVVVGGTIDQRGADRLATTGRYTGFRLDTSPSWTLRRKGLHSSVRLDVPLGVGGLRFRHSRELTQSPAGFDRISTGVTVDPFDESLRFSVTLGF
jgi:hypothetical protein